MIEYFGLDNIVLFLIFAVIVLAYQLDRSSKHAVKHIDKLQSRVNELEEKLGRKSS